MSALTVSARVAEVDAVNRQTGEVTGKVLDIVVSEEVYASKRLAAAKRWGKDRKLTLRIEPEEEAVRLDQYRHLFGHVFQPVVDTECGHTKSELCLMAKAQFMPDDGRTSLTELNAEEMADFIKQCEVWLHTEYPDAYALHDRRTA